MRSLVVIIALLCATSAQAKSVCLIGDSIMWGAAGGGSGRSRLEPGRVLQGGVNTLAAGHDWKDATIYNVGVSATHPSDWVGPVTSGLCTIVAAAPESFPPHLIAACRDGVGIADRIPTCDACIVLGDASEVQGGSLTVDQAVDELEDLLAKLTAENCADGVLLASPPLAENLAGTDVQTQYDAVRAEIIDRAITIDIEWSPRLLIGRDGVHLHDISYVRMADAFLRALP